MRWEEGGSREQPLCAGAALVRAQREEAGWGGVGEVSSRWTSCVKEEHMRAPRESITRVLHEGIR